jgi:large subunit ribosomal protein L9
MAAHIVFRYVSAPIVFRYRPGYFRYVAGYQKIKATYGNQRRFLSGGAIMKVILRETIESLGTIGSEVNVAKGYARNYLLPQGKALDATPQNLKLMASVKAKFDLQIAKEKAQAEEMAKQLEGVSCTIKAKVSEGDRLYGSVTVREIVEALAEQKIDVEKRRVLLAEPLKQLGTYQIPIRIYKDVEPEITVEVVPEED